MILRGNAQALKNAAGVRLGLPAAHLGILLGQLAGADAVLIGHVLLLVEGIHLLAHVIEVAVAHDDGVQHRILIEHELILLQNRHTHVGQNVHTAGGGFQLTGEDLQERGLTCAVGADNAIAVAAQEL